MRKFFRRLRRSLRYGEKGFTLIELLVVIAILGVLAAVAVPNVANFIGAGQTEAAAAELSNVQAAMDQMMVDTSITSVTATTATCHMSAFPSAPTTLYPEYMRSLDTKGTYSCSSTGLVAQASTGN